MKGVHKITKLNSQNLLLSTTNLLNLLLRQQQQKLLQFMLNKCTQVSNLDPGSNDVLTTIVPRTSVPGVRLDVVVVCVAL